MTTTSSVTLMPVMEMLYNTIGTEVVLLCCFVMGYIFFNSSSVQKRLQGSRSGDGTLLEKQTAAHLASGQYAAVLATIAQTPALLGMQVHAPRSGTYDKGRGVVLHGPEKPLIAVILQEKLGT